MAAEDASAAASLFTLLALLACSRARRSSSIPHACGCPLRLPQPARPVALP